MNYRFDVTTSMRREVPRAAHECLARAITRLDELATDDRDAAVHDVRKRCKELRALCRLVRAEVGPAATRVDHLARDAARELAAARDAHVVMATMSMLRDTVGSGGGDVRTELAHRQAEIAADADALGGDLHVDRARTLLREADDVVASWHLRSKGFGAVAAGLHDTYRRGRRDLARLGARPERDELEHRWRTSAKRLWYQLRLVESAAPSVLGPLVEQLDVLGEALGDDHDLGVMVDRLTTTSTTSPTDPSTERIVELARSRQRELRDRAVRLGATVYAEDPDDFVARIGAYWRTTRRLGDERDVRTLADLAAEVDVAPAAGSSGHEPDPGDAHVERRPDGGPEPGSAHVEHERKFLVTTPPPDEARTQVTELRQGYVAIDGLTTVRVRAASGREATLTVKSGTGTSRTELEWTIGPDEFEAAWAHTGGRRVRKHRSHVELPDGHVAELDVYHDALDGLVTVEVEFADADAAAAFEPPDWFGRDVTDDPRFTNARLSVDGLPDGDDAAT